MVGMVRAMKVAIPPTTKIAILITHMISLSLAWSGEILQSIKYLDQFSERIEFLSVSCAELGENK